MQTTITKLQELISNFDIHRAEYLSGKYDETQVRHNFIDKFFILLGWDVNNDKGNSLDYCDVLHEDKIFIENRPKAPDYSFKIGKERVFFVEAKKPSVPINTATEPAFQLRRYSYTAKLPFSILTDFQEFAIYDTTIKPNRTDKASIGRTFYCQYDEYEKNFDYIYNIFSKDAILKGSLKKYSSDTSKKKGTSQVDKEILKMVELWREYLAKNIALRNKELTVYQLNEAVQKIIDRILFLRIAEDRNTEIYGSLNSYADQSEIYNNLDKYFRKADVKYNSGLYKVEDWLSNLVIDDKILKGLIKELYYPTPYEFSVLPIEILGNIYEQFLGKTIRLTDSHQAKVEYKPEVRKAGGVYYTPEYIVSYIVKNTVGALLQPTTSVVKKTPEEISKLKILDPACGSGSFLVNAYSYLLDYHTEYYSNESNRNKALKGNKIYQVDDKTFHLTIEEKQKILLNNIYGVDIDSQAVETTKLSLLLKLMEGEILESAGELFKHSQKALLPDLKNNIKCGNSLIGSDFYTDKDMSLFGNEEIRKINTFDWEKEFPEIFYQGGFDCVIGNPPYVRQEMISEHKEYFEKKYKSYHGMADLFTYFIEIGLKVLKNERILSFIISNRFSFTNYGENLRLFLNNKNIEFIINFNGLLIFENANVDTMIIKIKNNESDNKIKICNVNDSKYLNILDEHIEKNSFTASKKYFSKNAWGFHQDKFLELRNKIIQKGISLSKVENIKVNRGITTGLNDIFIINEEIKNKLVKENPNSSEILKPILKGADIKRWFINDCKHFLIYSYTDIEIRKYTAIFNYLSQFKKELENVWEAKNNKKKWYELRGCNYYSEFAKEKIIWTRLSNINSFAISKNKEFSLDSTSFLISNAPKYYCALLNSKVIFFYFKLSCVIWGKDGIKWFGNNFDDIPLHIINFNNPFEKQSHDQLITLVDQMLEAQKEYHNSATDDFSRRLIKQKIDAIDTQIDNLVYKLYDLTDEEIRVVEGSK